MTSRYRVGREGDRIVVQAKDPRAKQTIWSWAGDYG